MISEAGLEDFKILKNLLWLLIQELEVTKFGENLKTIIKTRKIGKINLKHFVSF